MSFDISAEERAAAEARAASLHDPSEVSFVKRQPHYTPITDAAIANFVRFNQRDIDKRSKLGTDRTYQDYQNLQNYSRQRAFDADLSHQGGRGSVNREPNMSRDVPDPAEGSAHPSHPNYNKLDPDAAFRESILDALADADGAAYWRGVYGVDLNNIPRTKTNPVTGETTRTTDDERVAYARRMIFEAQNANFVEDQKKRHKKMEEARKMKLEDVKGTEQERRRRKERARAAESQRRMQEEIERSLRRGEERRERARQRDRFDQYVKLWDKWNGEQATIPWPTVSGGRGDMTERAIRSFLVHGLDLKAVGTKEFSARLKEQRVRWHPDKMQQKMGGKNNVDKDVMADITMIFQVIETLYDDARNTK